MSERPEWLYGPGGYVRPAPRSRYFRTSVALVLVAIVLASVATALAGAVVIGRALDYESAQFVTFTRPDGVTLTCERITDVAGRTFYDSCERVP